MWPFSKRRAVAREMTDSELAGVLSKLSRDLDSLREDHAALESKYMKLRGRVYAIWGKGGDDPDTALAAVADRKAAAPASPKAETREQLKAMLARSGRFIPGRPPVHTE